MFCMVARVCSFSLIEYKRNHLPILPLMDICLGGGECYYEYICHPLSYTYVYVFWHVYVSISVEYVSGNEIAK